MRKFQVGDKYLSTMIIGCADIIHTITSQNGNKVIERQEWRAEGTGELCSCEAEKEIKIDERDGEEYIVIWEYMGNEGRCYAHECGDDE